MAASLAITQVWSGRPWLLSHHAPRSKRTAGMGGAWAPDMSVLRLLKLRVSSMRSSAPRALPPRPMLVRFLGGRRE